MKIPKIIHQTWKNYDVPAQFADYIKSWLILNPDWEYWFWTDRDADVFIKLSYPTFYQMYREYGHHMQRADALRYFVLYEFGGWYADLDIQVLRPLEEISRKHYCMIPLEPWGQAIVTWNKVRLSSNAIMAASPRHPFFKRVIDTLPHLAKRRGPSPMLWSTGPFMIEDVITKYEFEGKQRKSGHFHNETVWLANPEVFLPVADKTAVIKWKQICLQNERRPTERLRQDYCGYLKSTNYANTLQKDAYTTHAWSHTYFGNSNNKTNIFKVVPGAKIVSNIIKTMSSGHDDRAFQKGRSYN
ncbi:uncharacterized protein LOC135502224 [Lineus longissimus]|uniref:uncharacterized protein LOC135502224 n=1 Tax=Lineus longissimus TaxID=88925 RepID=UPI00315D2F11